MTRINDGFDYLYCSISDNPSDWEDTFESAESAFNCLKSDIEGECIYREYNERETEKVLNHYEIKFKNWNGQWKG
jgi:hypothetical protein